MEVGPIPTLVNPADLGTLEKARTAALMHLVGMVDEWNLDGKLVNGGYVASFQWLCPSSKPTDGPKGT